VEAAVGAGNDIGRWVKRAKGGSSGEGAWIYAVIGFEAELKTLEVER